MGVDVCVCERSGRPIPEGLSFLWYFGSVRVGAAMVLRLPGGVPSPCCCCWVSLLVVGVLPLPFPFCLYSSRSPLALADLGTMCFILISLADLFLLGSFLSRIVF